MDLGYRVLVYLLLFLGGALGLFAWQYWQSQEALKHDPSAMAWFVFLPWIWPVFFIRPAMAVGVLVLLVELAILLKRLLT